MSSLILKSVSQKRLALQDLASFASSRTKTRLPRRIYNNSSYQKNFANSELEESHYESFSTAILKTAALGASFWFFQKDKDKKVQEETLKAFEAISQNDQDSAEQHFKDALQADPAFLPAIIGYQQYLVMKEDWTKYSELEHQMDLALFDVNNVQSARQFFQLEENKNHAFSHFAHGYLLHQVSMNDQAAVEYKKAIQLQPTMFASQYWLGEILIQNYREDNNKKKDVQSGLSFIRGAASNGYSLAQHSLFTLYSEALRDKSLASVIKSTPQEATKWLELSANSGNPIALCRLASSYAQGNKEGIPKNPEKAFLTYMKAAELNFSVAQNNVGWCYENGVGVQSDLKKAAQWYFHSCQQGYPQGCFNLARYYSEGIAVHKNPKKAVEFYEKAAIQGHSEAQLQLAVLHLEGESVKKDDVKAFQLLLAASQQESPVAQCILAHLYQSGVTNAAPADPKAAMYWRKEALSHGVNCDLILRVDSPKEIPSK